MLALPAAVAAHESLKVLMVIKVHFARGVNALVDAATERRVSVLYVDGTCILDADFVPALARLLQRGSLTTLYVERCAPDAEEASVLELCVACAPAARCII